MSFPSFLSQKSDEIPIFRTFLAKFSILIYISLEIGYFELGHDYDVTVRHTWNVGIYFGRYEKRMPLVILWPVLWYQLHVSEGFHFQVHKGW